MTKRFEFAMLESVRMRLSIEERQAIETAARKTGQTLADFARTAATEAARRVAA